MPSNDLLYLCSVGKIIDNLGVPEAKLRPNFLLAKGGLLYIGQTAFYL